jgi:hypothetical protein
MVRFNIRDVLFLMAVIALALGWWGTSKFHSSLRSSTHEQMGYLESRLTATHDELQISKAVIKAMEAKLGPGKATWERDPLTPEGYSAKWEPAAK